MPQTIIAVAHQIKNPVAMFLRGLSLSCFLADVNASPSVIGLGRLAAGDGDRTKGLQKKLGSLGFKKW